MTAYVLASTWRGASDSQGAFGIIGERDYSFAITVPPAAAP
jgi:hypothetical protein